MKIALIRSASIYMNFGSYNVQEIGLAKSLEKNGHQVDFYTREKVDEDKIIRITDSIRVYAMTCISLPGRNGYYPQMFKYLNDNQYDLIQVLEDSQIMTVLLSVYAKRKNIPFILWQGMYENYQSFVKKSFQFIFDLLLLPILRRNTGAVIGKTPKAIQYIESKGFRKTFIGGVGLDVDSFNHRTLESDILDRMNIPKTKKILLYIGVLEQRRNPKFLLEIIEKLDDKFVLVIAGDGPDFLELNNIVADRGLNDSVKLLGRVSQEDLIPLYKNSMLFLLPTDYEIYGMVILECMYYGLPVISTPCAGAEYLIDTGEDGFVLEKNDKMWVDVINNISNDSDSQKKISHNFKNKFDKFTWDSLVNNYLNVYESEMGYNK
ncbi:MAG: glycosyltransferase family 4 protein [Spirochaetales bacterium]|uniref:Glycosyltransferase family 4 protein n=1 Tax=Candidatus Thalassospirochaeta sargassi TaxID=3119039 RepID=A0AAJ1IG24_9SPIO|nr:glycosyltransferase family 4 protein [Spirochaetales bacterium]